MSLQSRRTFISGTLALALALTSVAVSAQKSAPKLSKQDVINLLTGDVSSDDVAQQARKSGISFPLTAAAEREIRGAGGTDALINTLRSLAPSTPAAPPSNPGAAGSPVLVIDASPGQSEVYVDDEPMGSTSREGRLKLTHVAAGSHRVRISLNGYQDHEETVTLTAGEVTTVATSLQKGEVTQIAAPAQAPSVPPQAQPPEAPSGPPGYLGVLPMNPQPGGARGVVISGAAPGGPADQIGLKTYDTILAVNGETVTTPDALRAALSSHPVGEVVNITWYNGSATVTRQARLAPYPTTNQTAQVPAANPALLPHTGVQTFFVAHDHGPNGQGGNNYCVGTMTIGNGMINYVGVKGTNGTHSFQIPLNTIRQAARNNIYLVQLGAFHIHTKRGAKFNFVLLNAQGKYQPPDTILNAIDNAMGK